MGGGVGEPRTGIIYDDSRLYSKFLATLYRYIREMINNENFYLNIRRSIWARILIFEIVFTIISDQNFRNIYE